MTEALTFVVPWAALCSDNRKFVSGSFHLSREYRNSKQLIGQFALAAARKTKWAKAEGPLALEAVVREPDRRRRDLNWSKNAKDGITAGGGVWWDDSQVRWELWRFDESGPPDKATAGATITIRTLDNFRDMPKVDADAQDPAPSVGRSGDVRGATAPGLQRARRVRGGATAPDEPAGPAAGGSKRGRGAPRTPRQRGQGGLVPRGAAEGAAQAGPVRPQAKAPRAPRHHERPK